MREDSEFVECDSLTLGFTERRRSGDSKDVAVYKFCKLNLKKKYVNAFMEMNANLMFTSGGDGEDFTDVSTLGTSK